MFCQVGKVVQFQLWKFSDQFEVILDTELDGHLMTTHQIHTMNPLVQTLPHLAPHHKPINN